MASEKRQAEQKGEERGVTERKGGGRMGVERKGEGKSFGGSADGYGSHLSAFVFN